MPIGLTVHIERWPIASTFAISRGAKTEAVVVVAELADGDVKGRGECVPYARFGESVEGVAAVIETMRDPVARGLDRAGLQRALPMGPARNALDCAFWDLEAKRTGKRVYELAGLPPPRPVTTAFTISLGTAENMAAAAVSRPAPTPGLRWWSSRCLRARTPFSQR
jgi:L-alanine-DL-glutamate epimerase-like enolase superfamily enzyme